MVILLDAVVTEVAMGASERSEDVAGVAELELKHHRRVCQASLHVEDP